MDETELLFEFVADRQAQIGPTRLEGSEFRAEQLAEGLLGQDAAAHGQKFGCGAHDQMPREFRIAEYSSEKINKMRILRLCPKNVNRPPMETLYGHLGDLKAAASA